MIISGTIRQGGYLVGCPGHPAGYGVQIYRPQGGFLGAASNGPAVQTGKKLRTRVRKAVKDIARN